MSFLLCNPLSHSLLVKNTVRINYTWVKKAKTWIKDRESKEPAERARIQKQECTEDLILVTDPHLPWETHSFLIFLYHNKTQSNFHLARSYGYISIYLHYNRICVSVQHNEKHHNITELLPFCLKIIFNFSLNYLTLINGLRRIS